MYTFGKRSTERLMTVHPELSAVAMYVMDQGVYDFTIIWGWRNEEQQTDAFMSGNSKKQWPDSNHNKVTPDGDPQSDALDFAPWVLLPSGKKGIPWNDTHAFSVLGGMFILAGSILGTPIKYGGDWDMDGLTTDQSLMDWGHIERLKSL